MHTHTHSIHTDSEICDPVTEASIVTIDLVHDS